MGPHSRRCGVVGVDPGLTGAIAHIHPDGTLDTVHDMPVIDGHINGHQLAHMVAGADMVVVETQQAMPKQGVASTFRTGVNYGIILERVAALGLPVTLVRPAEWTRALKVGADKEVHRRRAIEWYPQHAGLFARRKDDGRADAVLIARWYIDRHKQGTAA